MTREKAIEYNKNLREYMRITDKKSEYKFLQENYEALDMAIKALEYKKFIDLSNDEIKQIVTDIFHPKKITNIERHKKKEEITCTIYTEWEGRDDETILIADTLTLRNPFEYGADAIEINFSVNGGDYLKLKQFCFAKGIFSENWVNDNPYLREDENQESEVEE